MMSEMDRGRQSVTELGPHGAQTGHWCAEPKRGRKKEEGGRGRLLRDGDTKLTPEAQGGAT